MLWSVCFDTASSVSSACSNSSVDVAASRAALRTRPRVATCCSCAEAPCPAIPACAAVRAPLATSSAARLKSLATAIRLLPKAVRSASVVRRILLMLRRAASNSIVNFRPSEKALKNPLMIIVDTRKAEALRSTWNRRISVFLRLVLARPVALATFPMLLANLLTPAEPLPRFRSGRIVC